MITLFLLLLLLSPTWGDEYNHLAELKDFGFKPRAILDCGANVGMWTKATRSLFPDAKILMLEGNPDNMNILQRVAKETKSEVELAVLMDVAGKKVKFWLPSVKGVGNTGAGVFKEVG
jgi:ribosomal protein RSM22 (predicted rRNA methylase)